MPQPVYTPEVMANRVVRGDVGEGLFRLLTEERLTLRNTRIDQFGYNPSGVIATDQPEKRALLEWSGPDFALVAANEPQDPRIARPLLGISINTQAQFYSCHSTRGQGCHRCPWYESCYGGKEQRIWYNFYNVSNDYRRFHERYGVEVLMVTLLFRWRDRVTDYVTKDSGRQQALKRYVVGGTSAAEMDAGVQQIRRYLKEGGRRGVNRTYVIRWYRWSEIASGSKPWWATFGFTQSAVLPPKICLNYVDGYSENALWDLIQRIDGTGHRVQIPPPTLTKIKEHEQRLDPIRFVANPLVENNLRTVRSQS